MNTLKVHRLFLTGLLGCLLFVLVTGCTPPLQPVAASDLATTAANTPQSSPTSATVAAQPGQTLTGERRATLPIVIRSASPLPSPTPTETVTLTPEPPKVRFAVIGDYGGGGAPEADVARLVDSWSPEFVLTVGDNNYPSGSADTIDDHIGQFYHQYIYPYLGDYGQGADTNRFFPSLGNHDWDTPSAQPFLDYFTLPGNERYYDFVWGPVHFFALDSDSREPDGVSSTSLQAQWLQPRLEGSQSAWQIVYFHHAAYSSGLHGSTTWMRWPFASWGADAVLAGHDHTYERIFRDGIVYFVDGLGGGSRYYFGPPIEGSQVRYNDDYGAMLVEASPERIAFQFFNRQGELIDQYELSAPGPGN
jgi:hypothetical protein